MMRVWMRDRLHRTAPRRCGYDARVVYARCFLYAIACRGRHESEWISSNNASAALRWCTGQ